MRERSGTDRRGPDERLPGRTAHAFIYREWIQPSQPAGSGPASAETAEGRGERPGSISEFRLLLLTYEELLLTEPVESSEFRDNLSSRPARSLPLLSGRRLLSRLLPFTLSAIPLWCRAIPVGRMRDRCERDSGRKQQVNS